jgi:hypothetical protein
MRVSKNGSLKTKNDHAQNLRFFLQTDSISIVAPKRKKEKRKCFTAIVCLKKMVRFDLKV